MGLQLIALFTWKNKIGLSPTISDQNRNMEETYEGEKPAAWNDLKKT